MGASSNLYCYQTPSRLGERGGACGGRIHTKEGYAIGRTKTPKASLLYATIKTRGGGIRGDWHLGQFLRFSKLS